MIIIIPEPISHRDYKRRVNTGKSGSLLNSIHFCFSLTSPKVIALLESIQQTKHKSRFQVLTCTGFYCITAASEPDHRSLITIQEDVWDGNVNKKHWHKGSYLNTMPSRIYSTSGVDISHNLIITTGSLWVSFHDCRGQQLYWGTPTPPHPTLQDVSIMFLERRLDESNSNYYKITSHSCSFHSPHVAVDDILSCCPTCSSHPPAYKSKDKLPFETLRCSHPKSMIQAGGS